MMLQPEQRKILIDAALEAKAMAYSPYSNFPVGAALLTDDGEVIKGASIDNACYAETICAERVALVKAVSDGKRTFKGLSVVSNVASITPCGLCRQVIREFCAKDMPILLVPGAYPARKVACESSDGSGQGVAEEGVVETTIGILLPEE